MCIDYFSRAYGKVPEEGNIKEDRFIFGSQLEGTVCYDGEAMAADLKKMFLFVSQGPMYPGWP